MENNVDNSSQEKNLIKPVLILVLISFLIMISSTMTEYFLQPSNKIQFVPKIKKQKILKLKPPVKPLKLLPSEIDGFHSIVIHDVPGEINSAEALYESENMENVSSAAPLNTYVRIAFHQTKSEAENKINEAKATFKNSPRSVQLYDREVYTAYNDSKSTAYYAWTIQKYSVEIDTTYTATSSSYEQVDILNKISQDIANEVLKNIDSYNIYD